MLANKQHFTARRTAPGAGSRRTAVIVRADGGIINKTVKKSEPKVVDALSVMELPKKAVFCRCWKSSKFPYCDGAHQQHNKDTGDNVGPLIIDKPE